MFTCLLRIVCSIPDRCILLLEDIDAAFTRGIPRDIDSTSAPTAKAAKEKEKALTEVKYGVMLSLGGLLNSLDGVGAAEGR